MLLRLEYLSLNRETDTLSGGESQRVKIVKHLSSSLRDAMYIFDEPSVGLHPRDVHRLNDLLQKLRDKGNTVIFVEHDPDVIQVADHIVDVGPMAGTHGGTIVYEGSVTRQRGCPWIKPTVKINLEWVLAHNKCHVSFITFVYTSGPQNNIY